MRLKKILELDIPMVPSAKGRPRSTRDGRHYTPKKTKENETYMSILIAQAMQGRQPSVEALCLSAKFFFPVPKSATKKRIEFIDKTHRVFTSKPDIDNLLKSLMDSMNKIVWEDDKQVVSVTMSKSYAQDKPKVQVVVFEMVED